MTKTNEDVDNIEYIYHADTRSIIISEEITDSIARKVVYALFTMEKEDSEEPINIFINSPGGCEYSGFFIFDALRQSECHINTIAAGSAMSMGAVILQAGDTRLAYPNSIIMLHHSTDSTEAGPISFKNWSTAMNNRRVSFNNFLAEITEKSATFWDKKLNHDFVMSPEEALKLKLIDRIVQ